MSLPKALFVRVCVCFCVLLVLKSESDQILSIDTTFLTLWWTFSAICVIDMTLPGRILKSRLAKIVLSTAYISTIILLYAVTVQLFFRQEDTRRHFFIDCGLPFFNFNEMFIWIGYELSCLLIFLFNYLKHLGIGPVRVVVYLGYLGFNAVMLIFILETILTIVYVQVYLVLHNNFMFTFDDKLLESYPDGYFDPQDLREITHDKATRQLEMFSCQPSIHMHHIHMTCTQPLVVNYVTDDLPYQHEIIYRYIGEDITMTCQYIRRNPQNVHYARRLSWWLNESVVTESPRHSFQNTYTLADEKEHVTSVLTIKRLKDGDFGDYICKDTLQKYSVSKHNFVQYHTIDTFTVNIYHLKQLNRKFNIMYRAVGNLIATERFFWYRTEDDLNDMSFHYTINDHPVDEVCPGFETRFCSIGATILRAFVTLRVRFDWNGLDNFPYVDIEESLQILKRGIAYFCLCSNGYGIHKVTFTRHVHLRSNQGDWFEEYQHPYVYLILPVSVPSLFRIFDDSILYKGIEKIIENETDVDAIEFKVQQYLLFIAANEEKVFTFANFLQSSMLMAFFIFIYMAILFISKVYCKYFIYIPSRLIVFGRALQNAPEVLLAIEEHKYDLFLSHAEEEYQFASQTVCPYLEGVCGLKVCLPNRDMPPERSIFSSFVDLIKKSRKVIVVYSQSYENESQCRTLQLEHIILPLFYEKAFGQHDILVLRYGEKTLPDIIRWNFDILPWSNHLPSDVLLKKMKGWIFRGHV